MKKIDVFVKECMRWQEYFNLKNWRLEYTNNKEAPEVFGSTDASIRDRQAFVNLNPANPGNISLVKETAFHEVCEVLLTPLRQMALGQYPANEHTVDEACHDIIQRLTNTICREEVE